MFNKIPLMLTVFAISFTALANTYLGFDVGKQNTDSVIAELKKEGAKYDVSSYKGEGSLPFIKIKQSNGLAINGELQEGILMFDQNKILFGMDIKYRDDDKTFDSLKSNLDKEFGKPRIKQIGSIQTFTYDDPQDPSSGVQLMRTGADKGKNRITSVMYLNKKLFAQVEKFKKEIDSKLSEKKENKPQ